MNNDIKKFVYSKINSKSPTVVEVGVHYGEDTVCFLKIFRNSTVHCFEPDPRNIAIFKEHVASDRAILYEYAVSNADGQQVDFYQSYKPDVPERMFKKYPWIDKKKYIDLKLNASGASSLKQGHPLVRGANVVKVPTVRIDTWAEKNNIESIDFMWIDVQGAEKEVVEGFGSASDKIKFIWMEYGETEYNGAMTREQTIDMLSEIGFSVVRKQSSDGSKGNLLFQR